MRVKVFRGYASGSVAILPVFPTKLSCAFIINGLAYPSTLQYKR
jgi:hypothetical protein